VLVIAALPVLLVQAWVAGMLALFGWLHVPRQRCVCIHRKRLRYLQGEKLIRRFPQEWQIGRFFWPKVPILLQGSQSIHFLPILFDPKTLKTCLEQRCPTPLNSGIGNHPIAHSQGSLITFY